MLSRLACRCLYGIRFFQPRWQSGVGEQTGGERPGIHNAHSLVFQVGNALIDEPRVLKRVLVIRQHTVHVCLVADKSKDLLRISTEADESHLPRLLDSPERRNRFVHDLLHRNKLDVMAQDDVQIVRAQSMQTHIDTFYHTFSAKIEVLKVITAQFSTKRITLTRNTSQCDT